MLNKWIQFICRFSGFEPEFSVCISLLLRFRYSKIQPLNLKNERLTFSITNNYLNIRIEKMVKIMCNNSNTIEAIKPVV